MDRTNTSKCVTNGDKDRDREAFLCSRRERMETQTHRK